MKKWQRTDDGKTITKAGFRTITHKTLTMNNGKTINADIVSNLGDEAACIIALTPQGKVVIARQFRCGPELIMDELPGGMVDPGETPEQAARRELREEVGYQSENISYLGKAYVNAWASTAHHYYFALDVQKVGTNEPEEFEEIEIDEITIDQLIENSLYARMTDARGVLLAYDQLQKLKELYI